jgi:hypothetical protein
MHVPNVSDRDRALLRVLYQVRSDGLAAIVICSPVAGWTLGFFCAGLQPVPSIYQRRLRAILSV